MQQICGFKHVHIHCGKVYLLSCFSDLPHNFTVKYIPIFNHLDIQSNIFSAHGAHNTHTSVALLLI